MFARGQKGWPEQISELGIFLFCCWGEKRRLGKSRMGARTCWDKRPGGLIGAKERLS